eukprot:1078551-Prymnesium_polylepis.2
MTSDTGTSRRTTRAPARWMSSYTIGRPSRGVAAASWQAELPKPPRSFCAGEWAQHRALPRQFAARMPLLARRILDGVVRVGRLGRAPAGVRL